MYELYLSALQVLKHGRTIYLPSPFHCYC